MYALLKKEGSATIFTSFGLIALAEIGDKTQLICITLAARHRALPILVGATLALVATSAVGVLAGRALLQRMPMQLLHRLRGLLYLVLAGFAALHALRLA